MDQGILHGIRVLDFTWMLAGPYTTRILADFGAEVIKVQSKKTAKGAESNLTGYFNTWNRNKKGITLDLDHPEAKEILLKLTQISDVLVENYTPRVMSNWGLSYEKLKEVRPDLIMVSMSGFGQTGPRKDYVALGPTLQALSGFTYLTSFHPDAPMGLGYAYADTIAGLYGAFAILAALEFRTGTGEGQYIDLSELEAISTLMGPTLLDVSANHKRVFPQGNHSEHIPAAPYGCYQCLGEDRWCVIAVFDEREWKALCHVLGHPPWTEEEKFSTPSKRKDHEETLNDLLEQWTLQHTPEEVVDLLQKAGVSAGVIQNVEDLAKDPHLTARDFFIHLKHPILGDTISSTTPFKFKEVPTTGWKAAPLFGEHNRYVYLELLGVTEDELSSYIERGIIG